ncbi:MAG: RIP metalloprotease RseP [Bacteroidales bacterium]|nr:RIP metalloprotease RseP [Bacteroidales bacterium]
METILIKALQLLCCLSLLVVLHEGGHFFFSKLFKVRVEKFYLFFNPKFHLFSTKDKWFAKRFPKIAARETEYGIGWIPLGGYVKISGMIDESMDKEQLKQPAQPWEFRSQPVWKRFFIMVGGVLMNLITSIVIYCAIMFTWGQKVMPMKTINDNGGFVFNDMAKSYGFQDRDKLIALDGDTIKYWDNSIIRPLSEAKTATVIRNGKMMDIRIPEHEENMIDFSEMYPPLMQPYITAEIDSVMPGSPAEKAKLTRGYVITKINDATINSWADIDSVKYTILKKLAEPCSKADSVALRKMNILCYDKRSDTNLPFAADLELDKEYNIGIVKKTLSLDTLNYSFVGCIPAGTSYGWKQLKGYVHDLKYIFTKKGANSVGSFITIGSIFPDAWDWQQFWHLTALISIILAVMNILPIPGLDGGHVMFLLLEAVMGRPLSEKAQTWCEYFGMGLLILLMIWAFGNDLFKFVF